MISHMAREVSEEWGFGLAPPKKATELHRLKSVERVSLANTHSMPVSITASSAMDFAGRNRWRIRRQTTAAARNAGSKDQMGETKRMLLRRVSLSAASVPDIQ
jgi:hypothetical protein